ncbi:MAG TPA: hypothetical protein VIY07_07830 [Pseudolabrys sp.]
MLPLSAAILDVSLQATCLGARVVVPVGAPLKAALDAAKKQGPLILVSTDNRPWTPDGFRASWGKACAKAGIIGVTFNDLRDGRNAASAGRMHRGGDRDDHRTLAPGRSHDPRFALPAS